MNWVKLTTNKLNVESIYNLVSAPEFGAISLFVGTTRDNFEGKIVTKLEYEAYEQMAIKSLENICCQIRENFDVGNIAIFHRLGDVPIQEASVVIAISSSHRASALKAVPYAIDALKSNVPIWKKEIYANDVPSEWKENTEFENVCSAEKPDISQPVHLYEEVVETDSGNDIPSHLIQVKADLQEINRRINSFICRKRQQINESNIENFCLEKSENSENTTCARVSAVLKRRIDSKSHLKVHRVANIIGPQTHSSVSCYNESLQEYSCKRSMCPSGAEERLCNVESYLDINQHSNNVFARLKVIEDKILYLESVSPEYFGWEKDVQNRSRGKTFSSLKRTYSTSELDTKMQELEMKLQKKSNFNV